MITMTPGSGLIGTGFIGLVSAAVSFGLLAFLFAALRPSALRVIVALVFAARAAVAGYALLQGVTLGVVPSEVWRQLVCIIGGVFVGVSALIRLAGRAADTTRLVYEQPPFLTQCGYSRLIFARAS